MRGIVACGNCHTPLVRGRLDMTKVGAGGRDIEGVITANLTPANPDGMAKWTDAQVATAIRDAVRPDGRRLGGVMAFAWYRTVNDRDMDALIAYLRTLKPVRP
jgi:mono/diheme cytochrome c family protein